MSKAQKQTPKQGNTLFQYFSKTPKKDASPPKKGKVLSPRKSPNNGKTTSPISISGVSKQATNAQINGMSSDSSPELATPRQNAEMEFHPGDVVWAKVEGYPYWPAIVCDDANTSTHCKMEKHRKPQYHVHFFDNPPSWAWIRGSLVKPFKGLQDPAFTTRGGAFYSSNPKLLDNAKRASDVMQLSEAGDRLKHVTSMNVRKEDKEKIKNAEREDDQPMEEDDVIAAELKDLDPDIFDAEMSDDDDKNESVKENNSVEVTPSKAEDLTPSKKRARPTRQSASKLKRRRIVEQQSSGEEESGDDFKPSESEEDDSGSSGVDEDEVSEPESEPDSPVKKSSRKRAATTAKKSSPTLSVLTSSSSKSSFKPSVGGTTKAKLSLFAAPESNTVTETGEADTVNFPHTKLEFLQPDKIRDANKRSPSDPDYNPRTLYIPETFISKQTPAMRQWWDMKAQHFDAVLFFKMGKFYELFHMDSTIGVEELGLIYMKGEYAHSGFPEIAYSRYADALVQKGYKVARVEQTETPEMMQERIKDMSRATKFDKVVRREICQVTTQGIRTFSHTDGVVGDAHPSYSLAICEAEQQGHVVYGICFVDTTIGTFHIGQFTDDRHCSRLRTVLAHYSPVQILYERNRMSPITLQLIKGCTSALKEALTPGKEFWDSSKTLKSLLEGGYFAEEEGEFQWPQALKKMMSDSDSLGLTAADNYDLALRSLGAVVWYLTYCLIDHEVLSMKKFEEYQPLDRTPEKRQVTTFNVHQKHMVLDGVTLYNLEVAENASTGGIEGTLLEQLDTCSTPFGKRLLKQWLCAPLCQPSAVDDRLDAVESLMEINEIATETNDLLKKMPDLERHLSRIHSLGSARRSKDHPEGRAVLYEEVQYSKRKIEDFLATLIGFKSAMKIVEKFKNIGTEIRSTLLKHTVLLESQSDNGRFPDMSEDLEFFDKAFNHEKAKKDGVIVPSKGVDKDYDDAVADIKQKESQLQDYLESQKQRLGCRSLLYWGSGKNRYQVEVPEAALKRVPEEYELISSKKGAKRYRTKVIDKLLSELADAEERKDASLKDIMRRIFHSFDERHSKWSQAVGCLAVLDVLLAFARYSRCSDGIMCRPKLVLPDAETTPFLEIRDGRHPCLGGSSMGGNFIPNDTVIGIKDENDDTEGDHSKSRVVMVTGPNMGGKSTLMRQTGLVVILAQMGCYVPADKCCLSPVDRIFTRLGASDNIMSGESTFFVELSETSSILQHATEHSLVLMDELGRGTATYDGTAIAYSVVQELSSSLRCRSLFSTHYHSLVDQFTHDANVRTGHMACMVENEDEKDASQETITFLYKFTHGACPKSYGFNAARLASIPDEIIRTAVHKAKEFESGLERLHLFGKMCRENSVDCMKNLMKELHDICV